MNLREYQKKAVQTRIYENEIAFPYVVLGLVSEVTEFYEKCIFGSYDKEDLTKEAGDIMWYMALWAEETDNSLPIITAIADHETSSSSDVPCLYLDNMIISVGDIAGYMKKILRDDFNHLKETETIPELKKEQIDEEMSKIYCNLYDYLETIGIEMHIVLNKNIEKLFSRKSRNKLGGSGDNR